MLTGGSGFPSEGLRNSKDGLFFSPPGPPPHFTSLSRRLSDLSQRSLSPPKIELSPAWLQPFDAGLRFKKNK